MSTTAICAIALALTLVPYAASAHQADISIELDTVAAPPMSEESEVLRLAGVGCTHDGDPVTIHGIPASLDEDGRSTMWVFCMFADALGYIHGDFESLTVYATDDPPLILYDPESLLVDVGGTFDPQPLCLSYGLNSSSVDQIRTATDASTFSATVDGVVDTGTAGIYGVEFACAAPQGQATKQEWAVVGDPHPAIFIANSNVTLPFDHTAADFVSAAGVSCVGRNAILDVGLFNGTTPDGPRTALIECRQPDSDRGQNLIAAYYVEQPPKPEPVSNPITESVQRSFGTVSLDRDRPSTTPTNRPPPVQPTIVLNGGVHYYLHIGDDYLEPGAECTHPTDPNPRLTVGSLPGDMQPGTNFRLEYVCRSSDGGEASATRLVLFHTVSDPAYVATLSPDDSYFSSPRITANGPVPYVLAPGEEYVELGAVCTDDEDPNPELRILEYDYDGERAVVYQCTDVHDDGHLTEYWRYIVESGE